MTTYKNKFDEKKLAEMLNKKKDCRVDVSSRTIRVASLSSRSNDLGNKSWGKIDFLVHYKGYVLVR